MREAHTEVLVIGAGPVGLWSAVLLSQAGIQVTIIDREARTAARGYACALHPSTLGLLHRLGLAEEIIPRGRRVECIVFCDRSGPRARIDVSALGGRISFSAGCGAKPTGKTMSVPVFSFRLSCGSKPDFVDWPGLRLNCP